MFRRLLGLGTFVLFASCSAPSTTSDSGGTKPGTDGNPGGGTGGGGNGSSLPVYVLARTLPYEVSGNPDYRVDTHLDEGEIFVIPKSPLTAGNRYTCSMTMVAGGETFNRSITFTAAAGSGGYSGSTTGLNAINALRHDCGVTDMSILDGYTQSASIHAGYQKILGNIDHYESVSSNPCYRSNLPWDRISIALGRAAGSRYWGPNITMVAEDISSGGDQVANVNDLWNTLAHRLPMMRQSYVQVGYGNSTDAQQWVRSSRLTTGPAYLTLDFGGWSQAKILGGWPPNGSDKHASIFYSNSETPDPVPDANAVGGPLHVSLPTTQPLSSISVIFQAL